MTFLLWNIIYIHYTQVFPYERTQILVLRCHKHGLKKKTEMDLLIHNIKIVRDDYNDRWAELIQN